MATLPPNTNLKQQFPSMVSVSSMQSMLSMGYLPPGHGYVPKKQSPDKPYGLTFVTRMNRTARGPGRKYLNYGIACLIASFLFFLGAAIYFGHRNVSRMIVYRTEVVGALLVMAGICLFALMGHYLHKARIASNMWRANIRVLEDVSPSEDKVKYKLFFRPEGLFTAAAYNDEYVPEVCIKQELQTGTYGPKALKEIPKPKAMRKKKKKRRAQSKESLLSDDSLDSGPGTPARPPPVADPRLYDRRGQRRLEASSMERIIEEPPEYDGRTDTPESFQHPPVLHGTDNVIPPYQEQQSRPYPSQPGYYDNVLPQQQRYFYSDQPEMGAYYDNVPSPASPYIPDGDGYYMRSYPQQAASVGPPGQRDLRPGLEESEL